ncbi:MAG TPA: hypothetical protein VFM68_02365 [Candidatus Saccharimonadales bacterium]|nr:hypothetical protein [Candidatus Saccharimonadales bacterium]
MYRQQKTQFNKDVERLVMQRVRPIASNWTAQEQRIAIALVKAMIHKISSPLLVRKLRHENIGSDTGGKYAQRLSLIETDRFVGLRPEQQQLIEESIATAEAEVRGHVLAS